MYDWIIERIAQWTLGDWATYVVPVVLLALNMQGSEREKLLKWVKELISLPKVVLWENPRAYLKAARANIEDPSVVTIAGLSRDEVVGFVDMVLVEGLKRVLVLAVDLFYALLPFYYTFANARAKKLGTQPAAWRA